MCLWHREVSQAWTLCRWESHACAPLSCQRSCASMKCCQEMQSNEGMYPCWAIQKESDWLAQGLRLAPSLLQERLKTSDWITPGKKKKKKTKIAEEKVLPYSLIKIQSHPRYVDRWRIPNTHVSLVVLINSGCIIMKKLFTVQWNPPVACFRLICEPEVFGVGMCQPLCLMLCFM